MKRTCTHALLLAATLGLVGQPAHAQTSGCPPLDSTAGWARVNRTWSDTTGARWSNDSLRQVLLQMQERDQADRADFGAHATDSTYGARLMARDSSRARQMAFILDRFGLPTRAVVGSDGSDAAMLIVQHNWDLQQRTLALAKRAPPGQISPQALAMLEDRVLVHQGRRQIYGTQFDIGPDGRFHFAPTDDVAHLDARRASHGMPPMDQYVCVLEESGVRIDRSSLPRAP